MFGVSINSLIEKLIKKDRNCSYMLSRSERESSLIDVLIINIHHSRFTISFVEYHDENGN